MNFEEEKVVAILLPHVGWQVIKPRSFGIVSYGWFAEDGEHVDAFECKTTDGEVITGSVSSIIAAKTR